MKKFLLHLHREKIVPAARYCSDRFGCRAVLVVLAVLIGTLAALATSAMHALLSIPAYWDQTLFTLSSGESGSWLY